MITPESSLVNQWVLPGLLTEAWTRNDLEHRNNKRQLHHSSNTTAPHKTASRSTLHNLEAAQAVWEPPLCSSAGQSLCPSSCLLLLKPQEAPSRIFQVSSFLCMWSLFTSAVSRASPFPPRGNASIQRKLLFNNREVCAASHIHLLIHMFEFMCRRECMNACTHIHVYMYIFCMCLPSFHVCLRVSLLSVHVFIPCVCLHDWVYVLITNVHFCACAGVFIYIFVHVCAHVHACELCMGMYLYTYMFVWLWKGK